MAADVAEPIRKAPKRQLQRRSGELPPAVSDDASAIRLRLYNARNVAHERACETDHLDAGEIYHVTSRIAASYAFSRKDSFEHLTQVLAIIQQIFAACVLLETIEAQR